MPFQQIIDSPRIQQWLFAGLLTGDIVFSALVTYVLGPIGLAMLIAIAGATVALFTHPLVPFAMYFGALFFEDTKLPGLPVSINQLLGPLFLLSTFVYVLRGRTLSPRFRLFPMLALVTVYFVISGLTGLDLENGLLYSRYAVVYLIMAVSVAICLTTERTILALAWIIVISTTAAAIHGLVQAFEMNIFGMLAGNWGLTSRIRGAAPNSIVFAWNLVFAFPFAFLLFSELHSNYFRIAALLLGALSMGIAALSFNRQTLVLVGVVILLCALLYRYRNRAVLLTTVGAMGAIAAFTVLPLLMKRMLTVTNISRDISFLERRDSFLIGMEMFKDYPVTGVGFGAFSKVWRAYLPPDYSTFFSQYRPASFEKFMDFGMMSILVETGIIGLSLFLLLLGTIFFYAVTHHRQAKASGDRFAQNLSSTVIVILAFATVSSLIQDTFLYTRIWVFYGVAMLLDSRHLPVREAISGLTSESLDAVRPIGEDPTSQPPS